MMNKIFRSIAVFTISLSLVLSTNSIAFAAAVKNSTSVTTDRTLQDVQTGILTYNDVIIPHYATSTILSGKVVIDGPKLILKVNGIDVTDKANIVKVSDKTWNYSYTYSFNSAVGDIPINLEAYTVYVNGQPAENIHTKATPVTQTVHVPYVKSFGYNNLTWDSYDRITNLFTFSYNLIKTWDDGVTESAAEKTTATVDGTQSYTITAADPTHENGTPDSAGSVIPPVVFRNFTFPATAEDYTWTYNSISETYSVSFKITKLWSNGSTTAETKAYYGLIPASANTISISVEGVTNSTIITTPAAPVIPEITVRNAVGFYVSKETIAENNNNINNNSYNNYRVTCYVIVTLSDGTVYTSPNFEVTFPFNSGNTSITRDFSKTLNINGKDFDVAYTLTIK